jgi:hypothetical protein
VRTKGVLPITLQAGVRSDDSEPVGLVDEEGVRCDVWGLVGGPVRGRRKPSQGARG